MAEQTPRRLVVLGCAVAAVEMLLYSALAPLLPQLRGDFGLSKAQTGVLVAMYAIGLSVAAVPLGLLATSIGAKGATIAGLASLAATSVAFGLATTYNELLVTRGLQGAAGAFCWAGGIAWLVDATPRARRNEVIGLFAGASAGGAILGPAVGAIAATVGRRDAFAGTAVLMLAFVVLAARAPRAVGRDRQSLAALRRAHATGHVLLGQWLVVLSGILIGAIGVLAPLSLHRRGWGATGIAAAFLVGAGIVVVLQPGVGRYTDRRGWFPAIQGILGVCIVSTIALPLWEHRWPLLILVMVAITGYDLLWAPAMGLLSHAYEEAGVSQTFAFSLMSLTAGAGIVVGSVTTGELSRLGGDPLAYGALAGLCMLTAVGLAARRRLGSEVPSAAPGLRAP